jgi:hypothetical protein
MMDWTDEEWATAERRDPRREYLDVPNYNRDTWLAICCFVAGPALVITLIML